jgi:hypothetical protein
MKQALLTAFLALAGTASAQDAILYDTFNENDQANLFDCCNTLPVAGGRGLGLLRKVGMDITVETKTKIREIDIPISYFSGRNVFVLRITGPHMPKPAKMFGFYNSLPGGQCCVFAATEGAFSVVPGTYELTLGALVGTKPPLDGGWNLNTAGTTGDYFIIDQDGKHAQNGILPALRILTRP